MTKKVLDQLHLYLIYSLLIYATSARVIIEQDGVGWYYLRFGERGPVQNAVLCKNREELLSPTDKCDMDPTQMRFNYTKALTAFGLSLIDIVKGDPQYHKTARVLMIGLGLGGQARYLHHYFPDMELDIVEIDPELVSVVKQFTGVPTSDKFQLYVEDAVRFVDRQLSFEGNRKRKYDLIINDGFDNDGSVPVLNSIPFLNNLKQLLERPSSDTQESGIVVTNYWTYNLTKTKEVASRYQTVFSHVRVAGIPRSFEGEEDCVIIAHTPKADNDLVCNDGTCAKKKKKHKSKIKNKRKSKSGICEDINVIASAAAAIRKEVDMTMDIELVVRESWQERPFPHDKTLC